MKENYILIAKLAGAFIGMFAYIYLIMQGSFKQALFGALLTAIIIIMISFLKVK